MRTHIMRLGRSLIHDYRPLTLSGRLCKECSGTRPSLRPRKPIVRILPKRPLSTLFSPPDINNVDEFRKNPETHYDFFPKTLPDGPPPSGKFEINLGELKKEFLQLQAAAHPDRHQGKNKLRAEAVSSAINDAYKTLYEPLLRAQYLLTLRGIDVANDETAKEKDMLLLEEILNAREEIEEAEKEEDLQPLFKVNQSRIKMTEEAIAKALNEGDVETAKREVVRLRYWVNIKDSLRSWEKGKPIVLVH